MTRAQTQLEAPWQRTVCDLLESLGYDWMHVYPLQDRHRRWRTPTSGTLAKGWLDLFITKNLWVGFIECKGESTVVEPEQLAQLNKFVHGPFDILWVLRPADDLQSVAEWLARPVIAPRIYGWTPTGPYVAQVPTTKETP